MRFVTSEEIDEEGYTRVIDSDEGDEFEWICTQGMDAKEREFACSNCETCEFSARELFNF